MRPSGPDKQQRWTGPRRHVLAPTFPPHFCHTSHPGVSSRRSASASVQLLRQRRLLPRCPMCTGCDRVQARWWGPERRGRARLSAPLLLWWIMSRETRRRGDTQRRGELSHSAGCRGGGYLPCRQTHSSSPRGNPGTYNATYLLLHIYRSRARSQCGEALRNQETQEKESF